MSRRHKENDVDTIKTLQVESHEDGSPKRKRFILDFTGLIDKIIKVDTPDTSLTEKFSAVIITAFRKNEYEVDDDWVKIPRRCFERSIFSMSHELAHLEHPYKEKPKKGRPWLKRFIDKFEDCIVVEWFKSALNAVQDTCKELYQGLTQFAVCFQDGIHEAFCPDDDPYGKLSHFYRMLRPEISNLPSRETLSRNYRWFRDWREAVTFEDGRAKREKHKHRIWERLVRWIKEFLLNLAPQYAVQPLSRVGI